MKKIATLASAIALAATSLSVNAWWGGCMTKEQQQTKARGQAMAAQRRLAEQMTAQRAEMTKRIQAQGVDPMTMGFPPGIMNPWGDMGPVGTMDPWGANPWNNMGMPEYPSMPAMPEPFSMDMPQPQVPTFMRDRQAELKAYRSKVMEESKARRDKAIKEIAKRRKQIEANRFTHRHRYGRPSGYHYPRMIKAPEIPASAPQAAAAVKAPARVGGTAPTPEVTPTPVTTTTAQAPVTPAVPAAPVPASETAPITPASAAPVPQN